MNVLDTNTLLKIKDRDDYVVIDVRTEEEWDTGFVRGARNIFVEFEIGKERRKNVAFVDELKSELIRINIPDSTESSYKLVFVCDKGNRSAAAIAKFQPHTNLGCINYITGISGVDGWLDKGFKLSE